MSHLHSSPSNPLQLRNKLRQEIRNTRKALSKEQVQYASAQIREQLLQHSLLEKSCFIASYMSFANEVDTVELNQELLKKHKLALPVIDQNIQGKMDFYQISSFEELSLNKYSILEPLHLEQNKRDPQDFDVILVPLVGFNQQGDRLGMGGGYYDRMLKLIPKHCLTIGLAYDFQLVSDLTAEPWDMPLHEVITPTHHFKFNEH